MSLALHPDRVPACDKKHSTQKFQLLSKLYSVLSNRDSRQLYDEKGVITDTRIDNLPVPTHRIDANHIEECRLKFIGMSNANDIFCSYESIGWSLYIEQDLKTKNNRFVQHTSRSAATLNTF